VEKIDLAKELKPLYGAPRGRFIVVDVPKLNFLMIDGSGATFHKWKANYGGLDVSDAKWLKALEDENAKLKRLLADAMLDKIGLKELLLVRPPDVRNGPWSAAGIRWARTCGDRYRHGVPVSNYGDWNPPNDRPLAAGPGTEV